MKKIILTLIILIFINNLYSQNQRADIIFNDGTVIEGYGKITKKNDILFRITLDEEPGIWTSLMVKGIIFYGFEMSLEYEYIKLKEATMPRLLEVVSSGKASLYNNRQYYSTNFGSGIERQTQYNESSSYYVKRENEEIATSLNGNFKKIAKDYFKDCDVIQDLIESGEFRKYSKEEILDDYNIYCAE